MSASMISPSGPDNSPDATPPAPHRTKMAVPKDTPPGLELDDQGKAIPFEKPTPEDQERTKAGR
jgi:hypothetical protein